MRQRGKVKWYNWIKGFGFVTLDSGAGEVFLHHKAIRDDPRMELSEGQALEFDVVPGPRGPEAANVVPVDGAWPPHSSG